MEEIRKEVIECLDNNIDNDAMLIKSLQAMIASHGKEAYPAILHVLTNLELGIDDAEKSWGEILTNLEFISAQLGRNVSLRTAIVDYFCSINKSLKNPKLVEIHIFEKTNESYKFDSLTGLSTRAFFNEAISREISRAKRQLSDLSVLFFDLDDFKKVNDTYGHQAGDEVLKEVSKIILHEKRNEDIAARYGGEELVILMPDTGKVKALVLGERIREKVEGAGIIYEDKPLEVTISGGLASYPIDSKNSQGLLKCADVALYDAKDAGKNNVVFYSQDKRRYIRIDFNNTVVINDLGIQENGILETIGKNISIGGILITSDKQVNLGAKIQMTIQVKNNEEPINVVGTVMRQEAFGHNSFELGVVFLDLGKIEKNVISSYLVGQLQKELDE